MAAQVSPRDSTEVSNDEVRRQKPSCSATLIGLLLVLGASSSQSSRLSRRVVSDAACCAIGLGSNPGEDRDVYKCIVPSRHGETLNNRRAVSPLARLMEGEGKWEASDHSHRILPLNWGGTEPNSTVTCMVLKATAE
ncbi:uncharacterized protein TNCV_2484161 [Trichonephila clavipes]|uniref:Uncharacterized protein n=1 Tax=Trichonephila clavipes TaxID=2585209 RepID=A0A8X6VZP0_TRICX|nr:uncharacterized protein TNCV_2484161 [Trichonephila clavipes]